MTPRQNGIEERTYSGWDPNRYYIVDVAFSPDNVIHRRIFYSGFLNKKRQPGGYNQFFTSDERKTIIDAYYLKVIVMLGSNIDNP